MLYKQNRRHSVSASVCLQEKFGERRKLWIHAFYIVSKENVEADAVSRNTNLDTEWQLSDRYFKQIVKNFGTPSVDLFASRVNKKCKIFLLQISGSRRISSRCFHNFLAEQRFLRFCNHFTHFKKNYS